MRWLLLPEGSDSSARICSGLLGCLHLWALALRSPVNSLAFGGLNGNDHAKGMAASARVVEVPRTDLGFKVSTRPTQHCTSGSPDDA